MQIKFSHTIIFVKDIAISKKFYSEILNQPIKEDFGTIVFFDSGLAIHEAVNLLEKIYKKKGAFSSSIQGKDNILVYFESADLESVYQKISEAGIEIIHPIEKQEWGQEVFRFYDPDRHVVEIGEPMH